MSDQQADRCKCGANGKDISVDVDWLVKTTHVECLKCGRTVGGLTHAEAVTMWNSAMEEPQP